MWGCLVRTKALRAERTVLEAWYVFWSLEIVGRNVVGVVEIPKLFCSAPPKWNHGTDLLPIFEVAFSTSCVLPVVAMSSGAVAMHRTLNPYTTWRFLWQSLTLLRPSWLLIGTARDPLPLRQSRGFCEIEVKAYRLFIFSSFHFKYCLYFQYYGCLNQLK